MNLRLGPRLSAIAAMVPSGSILADIGSDHGYLPAWLLLNGKISRAIAVEVNLDPARRSLETCREYGLDGRMEVRVGDGLQAIGPGEVDVVVIAGMGGTTIANILEQGEPLLAGMQRLILQPNGAAASVRRWLSTRGQRIVDENLVEENGIIYEIIAAKPGVSRPLNELELLLGPINLQKRPTLLWQQVSALINERQYILRQLSKSTSAEATAKSTVLQQQIIDLQSILR
ncbi:MAG: tRNA (adenine(22)-N(1))-methyltransferase [Bacillota bacterium]|jgi:tRNA (adenine22-N1)-methyltransferase